MMKHDKQQLLRQIPAVEALLQKFTEYPRQLLLIEVRAYLLELRKKITNNIQVEEIKGGELISEILENNLRQILLQKSRTNICQAINATGIVLHTGLGRAVLPQQAIDNIALHLKGYSIVEIDRTTGERNTRDFAVKNALCSLTKAENATVVNNNAGAILIALAALTWKREVIVSRGQLVEIGGSFRVPDVMAESGAQLVEVGCTNCTHLHDYENAINERTAAILYVHTSNYKICGFSKDVPLKKLAQLCKNKNILLLEDAGSGAIIDYSNWGLNGDPIITESIMLGADIVTFSADKLFGSCQAGIIVGKDHLLKQIRKHPLARALRVDKITLSILESTLNLYLDKKNWQHIPTIHMLSLSSEEIKKRAEYIAVKIKESNCACKVTVEKSWSMAGSGSFPTQQIPSYAVVLKPEISPNKLASLLRDHDPAVFVRIQDDFLLIDPRTLLPEEDKKIGDIIKNILAKLAQY